MTKSKKITLGIFAILLAITVSIFFKLAFDSINSSYLKNKISTYVLDTTGKYLEIDTVSLRLIKSIGLAIEIPNAEINFTTKVNIKNTIIDIDIINILLKGLKNSNFQISSKLDLDKEQSFDVDAVFKNGDIIIKKISSDNLYLSEEIYIKKDNYHMLDVNLSFSKHFIDQNFNEYLKKINNDYNLNLSNLFFEKNKFYKAKVKINFIKQLFVIERFDNMHNIKLEATIDYSKNDKKIKLNSVIPNVSLTKIIKVISTQRDTNNKKILKIISDLLYKEQLIVVELNIDSSLEPKDITLVASGQVNLDYQFDKNVNPSYLNGKAPYKITLFKKTLSDNLYKLSSSINLNDANFYLRQINLRKEKNEYLALIINSSFDLKKGIELDINTKKTGKLSLNGKIKLSKNNDLIFNNIYIYNKDNVDLTINGKLKNRNLITKITGNYIDLSKNIIKINDKVKDYYYQSEKYEVLSKVAYLNGGIYVDNFSVNIDKKKDKIIVKSSGDTLDSNYEYVREKDTKIDVAFIKSGNIINTVGPEHSSRDLIRNGKATVSSFRMIGNLETNIEVNLENFVLINSPALLKLLSLPSFSGLSSAINNETGIEFAYGKLSYKASADAYSDINAFAVNDGIGLVIKGDIDRKNKKINLDGQVSPLHLISGIIQKIPFFGKILIGNEGEGILAVEYSMSGDQENPDVSSNPLTIFKPRLFQRTVDFLNNNIEN